jgi:hypothetical protein
MALLCCWILFATYPKSADCCNKSDTSLSNNKSTNNASYTSTTPPKAADGVSLGFVLLKALQQGWNEDNGKAGNFYKVSLCVVLDQLSLFVDIFCPK